MIYTVNDRIFKIEVRLPDSPLKLLNAYVLKGDRRNLLIDTGFNRPECYEDLMDGIKSLDLDMRRTDIFLTHCHADHMGLVPMLVSQDTQVFVSRPDFDRIEMCIDQPDANWTRIETKLLKAGFPYNELQTSMSDSPAILFLPEKLFAMTIVGDGDTLDLGGMMLRTVLTPGHTPGHMCLYFEEEQILFLGDHVLFDITPNITDWPEMEDSLGEYLESLKRIRKFAVRSAMPGHRKSGDLYKRIDDLLDHHEERLDEAYELIRSFPYSTGYETAARMRWKMRNKTWDDFPISQKTFAVSEAMSHINHMERRGLVVSEDRDGISYYRVNEYRVNE